MSAFSNNETRCRSIAITDADPSLIESMWGLFSTHYENCDRASFENDLAGKKTILLLSRGEDLIGFTSMRFETVDDQRVTYSGDVVVIPEARDMGTASLFQQWAHEVWNRCDWWCYLSAGPRTYRIPHTFYKRVTPGADVEESPQEESLRHSFAERVYGDAYSRKDGIVRIPNNYTMTESEQEVRSDYPMDKFFRSANPNWRKGDELVSLIKLSADNWKPIALRMLRWKQSGE